MKKLLQVIFISFAVVCPSFAYAAKVQTPTQEVSVSNDSVFLTKERSKIEHLEKLIFEQDLKIKQLEAEKKSADGSGMNFAVWIGILLASVSVVVTVLGVVMAIFSFYGYRKMIDNAKRQAANEAKSVASTVAKANVHDATKTTLIELINDRKLDSIFEELVEKNIYRDRSLNSLDEEGV